MPEGRSKRSEWLFVSRDRLAHWSSNLGSESAPTLIKGWAPDWHSITVFGMDEWRTEVNFESQVGQCELAESHWARGIQSVLLSSNQRLLPALLRGPAHLQAPASKMTSSKKGKCPLWLARDWELKSSLLLEEPDVSHLSRMSAWWPDMQGTHQPAREG